MLTVGGYFLYDILYRLIRRSSILPAFFNCLIKQILGFFDNFWLLEKLINLVCRFYNLVLFAHKTQWCITFTWAFMVTHTLNINYAKLFWHVSNLRIYRFSYIVNSWDCFSYITFSLNLTSFLEIFVGVNCSTHIYKFPIDISRCSNYLTYSVSTSCTMQFLW